MYSGVRKALAFKVHFLWLISVLFIGPVYGQSQTEPADPFAKFGEYTADSDLVIHHLVWSSLLYDSVIVIIPSAKTMAKSSRPPSTGTKIRRGSNSAARFEGNRVLFHAMNDDFLKIVSKYRTELEILPNYFPLAFFNKDEQLAYWLNLHNVIVYDELAKRYPISKLKKLRQGNSKNPSLWDEKLVTIEGVPLSLNDIQNNILIRHWQTPMVIYGFYQGAIGGPSLPNRAFTGANVHTLLMNAAKDFINSNRAIKSWGKTSKVSLIYDWGRSAFPDWERDLAKHIVEIGNSNRRASLEIASNFEAKLYDWSIADTKGGSLSSGPMQNTAANLLTQGPNSVNSDSLNWKLPQPGGSISFGTQGSADFVVSSTTGADSSFGAYRGDSKDGLTALLSQLYRNNTIMPGAYNSETIELLRQIKEGPEKNSEGNVTSYECGTDPCPEGNPLNNPEDDENNE